MSYILEALRKSERERQLGQAPSLPVLVTDVSPQRQRWLPWGISILLLAMNISALVYFGFGNKETTPTEAQRIVIPPPVQSAKKAEPEVVTVSPNKLASMQKTLPHDFVEQQRVAVTRTDAMSAPINNQTAPKQARTDAVRSTIRSVPEKTVAVIPPADYQKPLPAAVAVQDALNKAANDERSLLKEKAEKSVSRTEALEVKRPAEKPVVSALPKAADDAVKTEVKREELPSLSAMPEDIRSRIPPLTVNMLAYSSLPKERFAVVNMVKYTNGDQLPGGAVLLEIRSDGLVLDLDGTRFRVPQR